MIVGVLLLGCGLLATFLARPSQVAARVSVDVRGTAVVSCPRYAPNVFLNVAFPSETGYDWLPPPRQPRGSVFAAIQSRGGGTKRPSGVVTYGYATDSQRFVDGVCRKARVPKQHVKPKLSAKWYYRRSSTGNEYWVNRKGAVEFGGQYNCLLSGRIVVRVAPLRSGGRVVGSSFKAWRQPTGELLLVSELRSAGASWYQRANRCVKAF